MFKREKEQHLYYDAYYYSLFKQAYSKTGNMHDAEDLCHEVFAVFFEKYETIENKKSWLYGALRFALLRYRDKKNKKNIHELEPHVNDLELEALKGRESTDYDIRLLLAEAFRTESEEARNIFELKTIYNWTYRQISEQFNLSFRRVRYVHEKMSLKILHFFKSKGIKEFEDLL